MIIIGRRNVNVVKYLSFKSAPGPGGFMVKVY